MKLVNVTVVFALMSVFGVGETRDDNTNHASSTTEAGKTEKKPASADSAGKLQGYINACMPAQGGLPPGSIPISTSR